MQLILNRKSWRTMVTIVALTVAVIGLLILFLPKSASGMGDVIAGQHVIHVELATTQALREKGLGERDSMEQDRGMLFVFAFRGVYPFWMKNMRFPVDIIWLDNGYVVDMATLQPPKNGQDPQAYTPRVYADRVLELNAGQAKELGIDIGTKLVLPR